MVRYLFYTTGDLTYQSTLVLKNQMSGIKAWMQTIQKRIWK